MKLNPVLFIGYRRVTIFKKAIQENYPYLKGRKIYLSLDGPKTPEDSQSQTLILHFFKSKFIFFKSKTHINNLGCSNAVTGAIDWFFSEEKKGIIIEDDIFFKKEFLISADLFLNSPSLVKKYLFFSGYNPLANKHAFTKSNPSFFQETRFSWIWGWATDKSSWNLYKRDVVNAGLTSLWKYNSFLTDNFYIKLFFLLFTLFTRQNKNSSWDIRFFLSGAKNKKNNLIASSNLTTNLGNDSFSTHTPVYYKSNLQICPVAIRSPKVIPRDSGLDDSFFREAWKISFYKISRLCLSLLIPNFLFFFLRNKIREYFLRGYDKSFF